MLRHLACAALLAAPLGLAAPAAASAHVILTAHAANTCLDMKDGTQAIIWSCHGQGNQDFRFKSGSYGELMVGGRCLSTSGGQGSQLIATGCNGSHGQKWTFTSQNTLRNEEGWCADIERGSTSPGTRVIAWNCSGASNQRWTPARAMSPALAQSSGLLNPSQLSSLTSGQMVRVDPAKVVAAGGMNVIAAGGGNVIAAGGGNVYVPISGVVAAGGGN